MSKLSVVILTKNSENLIVDCVESVHGLADEIIVIDSNSDDRTVDIAKHLGARVEHLEGGRLQRSGSLDSFKVDKVGVDFSSLRNLGQKKAKYKWLLYIDADERVTPELKDSILQTIRQAKPAYQAYKIQRKNFYLGNYEWPYIEKLERFFEKSSLRGWAGELHESPKIDGETGILQGFLLHFTHSDLTTMVNKTISWSSVEAALRFKNNHPPMTWWRFPRVMLTAFYDSFIRQKGYKAGTAGLIESIYQSFSMFITYARLWELQQNKKNI